MTRKYRQGMESGDADTNQRDTNPNISRRDWLKLGVVGVGLVGLALAGRKYIEYNPQTIEKWCNEIMRRNKDPDAVENIHEKILRYKKELEELVEYAQPIRTFEELDSVRRNLRENYKLVNDIYCPQGHNWEPIGDYKNPFIGTFNGQGHTIYGLRAEWPERDYVGMFGYVGFLLYQTKDKHLGAVANLKLENIRVEGRESVGKVAGVNHGFITNCYASGEAKGYLYLTGGVVGDNRGILNRCSNIGMVEGREGVGGLVGGLSRGYIVDCLPNPQVKGKTVGTLIGWDRSDSDNEYDFSDTIIRSLGTIGLDE